ARVSSNPNWESHRHTPEPRPWHKRFVKRRRTMSTTMAMTLTASLGPRKIAVEFVNFAMVALGTLTLKAFVRSRDKSADRATSMAQCQLLC
ncbi:unnamed protein product, partial [Aphanomyces euteiches]